MNHRQSPSLARKNNTISLQLPIFIRGHTHASTEPVPLDFANIPKRARYMKKLPLHSPILISRNVRCILYVAVTFIIFFRILLLRAIWHVRIGGLYKLLEVQPLVRLEIQAYHWKELSKSLLMNIFVHKSKNICHDSNDVNLEL
jgi:hypothetical protein